MVLEKSSNNKTYIGFSPYAVTLAEMMSAREKRAEKIQSLTGNNTVVCVTMNFIGEYKVLPFSRALFRIYARMLEKLICAVSSEVTYADTGDTAFFTTNMPSEAVKALCEKAEDSGKTGRLFDIDVFDKNGDKLSRSEKRRCLICSRPAVECARSRAHGIEPVREYTSSVLSDFFTEQIAELCKEALKDEVDTTPKPGLVDRNNSGANTDMDREMFHRSAEAIAPYLAKMFALSGNFDSINSNLAENLRIIGIDAEKAMYEATNGVNTHKGAIYSMGLLCAAAGFVLSYGGNFSDIPDIASELALLLSYEIKEVHTHGLDVCRKYGVTGARGEAIGGFKTVLYAFNRIKYYADDRCLDTNQAYPLALCDVMAVMTDTNVLHRAGQKGLHFLHKEAKEISEMRENQRIDDLLELDKNLIEKNISPGGCADALACALFLLKAEKLFASEKD